MLQMLFLMKNHNGSTSLTTVPGIHFIKSFPLDCMHLVCLGVMRTIIFIWTFGQVSLKLPHTLIASMSSDLISLRPHIPSEFC